MTGSDIDTHILEEAADWLTLLHSGEASQNDQQRLTQWQNTSPMHRAAWLRAEAILGAFKQLPGPLARETLSRADSRERRRVLKTAVLCLLATPAAWITLQHSPWTSWQADLRTAKGEQKTVQLSDGSELMLNTATTVDIRFTASTRRLQLLTGEMLVTTGNDPSPQPRPFLVQTAEGQLRALGTRFTVRQFDELTLLAVFDGAVEISLPGTTDTAIVPAGQQRHFSRRRIYPEQPARFDTALWQNSMLLATDMPLGKLIAELSRYRHGILRCDPSLSQLPVSGAFPVNDTDTSLALLEKNLPVVLRQISPWWISIHPSEGA